MTSLVGFKMYRDQKGRFISKAAWQVIPKRKRKSVRVAVKRDAKGRFISEKFLSSKIKLAVEKKKSKPKPKIKRCNFSKVHELINQHQINKVNVTGVANLTIDCLAILIDTQIKRGAFLFRFWYKGNSYHKGTMEGIMRSTALFDVPRLRKNFPSTKNFLQSLAGPVLNYWMDIHAQPKIHN